MKDKIVIFGASGGAVKVAQTLLNLGYEIEFFVDNDINKHGSSLLGRKINGPETLVGNKNDYVIVIASLYHGEIRDQLLQMGIRKEKIVSHIKYVLDYINSYVQSLPIFSMKLIAKEQYYLLEAAEANIMGGIERWCKTLWEALNKETQKALLFTNYVDDMTSLKCSNNVYYHDFSFDKYKETSDVIINEIVVHLPCTVVISRINQVFMAAAIVKKFYKDKIKIISVLHSDFIRVYEQNALIDDYVDAYLCVSNDVMENFVHHFPVNRRKVFYKDSPIMFEENIKKTYTVSGQPIVLGYGARLERVQKRADLLIPLIQRLEDYGINYMFHIAGGGGYFNILQEYVMKKELQNKVKLFGSLLFEVMNEFWKNCDVFINLSDIEGTSLSMLEAMSIGVVPIVTNTAGAASFITNDVNGYVIPLRDINSIANRIKYLYDNRERLCTLGDQAREVIKDRCCVDDYIDFIKKIAVN